MRNVRNKLMNEPLPENITLLLPERIRMSKNFEFNELLDYEECITLRILLTKIKKNNLMKYSSCKHLFEISLLKL